MIELAKLYKSRVVLWTIPAIQLVTRPCLRKLLLFCVQFALFPLRLSLLHRQTISTIRSHSRINRCYQFHRHHATKIDLRQTLR